MKRARVIHRFAGAVVLCCLLSAPLPAPAGAPGGEIAIIGTLGGIAEVYLVIAVPIYTFTNLYYAVDGERPSQGWISWGYFSGGLCIAGGVAWMFVAEHNDWDGTFVALGAGHLLFGALDIGFTVWASDQPEKPDQKLTLAPIVMPDARGNPAFGIGLRLVDW